MAQAAVAGGGFEVVKGDQPGAAGGVGGDLAGVGEAPVPGPALDGAGADAENFGCLVRGDVVLVVEIGAFPDALEGHLAPAAVAGEGGLPGVGLGFQGHVVVEAIGVGAGEGDDVADARQRTDGAGDAGYTQVVDGVGGHVVLIQVGEDLRLGPVEDGAEDGGGSRAQRWGIVEGELRPTAALFPALAEEDQGVVVIMVVEPILEHQVLEGLGAVAHMECRPAASFPDQVLQRGVRAEADDGQVETFLHPVQVRVGLRPFGAGVAEDGQGVVRVMSECPQQRGGGILATTEAGDPGRVLAEQVERWFGIQCACLPSRGFWLVVFAIFWTLDKFCIDLQLDL